jgi:hypothetical protein
MASRRRPAHPTGPPHLASSSHARIPASASGSSGSAARRAGASSACG